MDTSDAWYQPVDQSGWDVEDTSYLDPKTVDQQYRVDGLNGLIPFWIQGVRAAERGEEVAKMAKFYEELDAQERLWAYGSSAGSHGKIQAPYSGWGSRTADWDVDGQKGGWGQNTGLARWSTADWDVNQEKGDWGQPTGSVGWEARDWNSHEVVVHDEVRYTSGDVRRRRGDIHNQRRRQKDCGSEADKNVRDLVSKYAHRKEVRPERRRQMYDFLKMSTEDKVQKIQEMIYRLQSNEL